MADDDAAQARLAKCGSDLGIERGHIECNNDFGLGVIDLAKKRLFGAEWIIIHHRAAGLEDRKIADHAIGRVGQEEPDFRALAPPSR